MPKFTIYKSLGLKTKIDAPTAREAYEAAINMDDSTFEVVECDYEVYDEDGESVGPEEYE